LILLALWVLTDNPPLGTIQRFKRLILTRIRKLRGFA